MKNGASDVNRNVFRVKIQKFNWFSKLTGILPGLMHPFLTLFTWLQLLVFAAPCSTFPKFADNSRLSVPATSVPWGHVRFCAKASSLLSFAVLRTDSDFSGLEKDIAAYQSLNWATPNILLVLVMGFIWYALLACLREKKWEKRKYFTARHAWVTEFKFL